MQMRGLAAGLLVSAVGAGFSAQALQSPEVGAIAAQTPVSGYEAEDHFPGAALYHAVDDDAAVAAGTTGTIALPAVPVAASLDAASDGSVRPAQPFRLAGTAQDRARALQCLTSAIYYEAASEPDNGQRAVAQVVLNRVRHSAFPASVCGVVFQGSERRGCQFSFACDGAMARVPSRAAWMRAQGVAAAALAGSVFAPVGLATHYHTYAVTPSWNRSLVMTGVFGAHFFHRWKGWWGTAAAFGQAYRGGEPVPGPHAPVAVPEPVAALPQVVAAPVAANVTPTAAVLTKPVAATPIEQVQPAYAQSGAVSGAYDNSESQILDKWKDSGKPLR
ncbi:cell wall hydrolase [Sphingomonas sp. IC-56]|uniref:cell wall hydrolase n=1 Tax=Sphingomonas sp. IC-56 TaxID=2898529 RepID=UPI001E3B31F7|nr:cell wall hydrolase [Sphingomonas sp. IC-56]MCD2324089.1 cell wall hydrolase [Sphingomonas sp. IC-56]